jgi:hypothetical protein
LSSASKNVLVIKLRAPPRISWMSLCGVPRHSRPDINTLVSRTARTPPTLGADRLYLRIDLFYRHFCDACLGYPIGNRKQRICGLAAPDRIGKEPIERLRRQESCISRCLRRCVRQLDFDLSHDVEG